jgi:hypothetical protein
MRVLIAVASRHGATVEIAETIGSARGGEGTQVDVVDIDDVHGLGDCDAVVLGIGRPPVLSCGEARLWRRGRSRWEAPGRLSSRRCDRETRTTATPATTC